MNNISLSFVLRWLVAAGLVFMLATGSAYACSQQDLNGISLASRSMVKFSLGYSKCTSIGENSARSKCWQENPLTTEMLEKYRNIEGEYYSFITSCRLDSIRYNLGNFKQSFGFECEAFDVFGEIEAPASFKGLDSIMAGAALQCAINSQGTIKFEEKKKSLRDFILGAVGRNLESSDKKKKGRLLGVWRDYFALNSSSSDSLSIANSIHASEIEWESWTMFLQPLRGHLVSWRGALFPDRQNISTTARQYALSVSKLSK